MTEGGANGGHHRELILATRNRGKAAELRALLVPLGMRILDLEEAQIPPTPDEDAIEDGDTFEANALAKARYFAARVGNRSVIADDSGLCVRALGGAPGVRSRRFAGVDGSEAAVTRANSARLLQLLDGRTDRSAEFVCSVAYIQAEREIVCTGRVIGRILEEPVGTHGFGYDPLFWSMELGQSFGAATDDDKARVSHRARAIAALVQRLWSADRNSSTGALDR